MRAVLAWLRWLVLTDAAPPCARDWPRPVRLADMLNQREFEAQPPCTGPGICEDRLAALKDGSFLPTIRYGWTFPRGTRRSMSIKARYFAYCERAERFPHPPFVEEPAAPSYAWETCPFCGRDLPDAAQAVGRLLVDLTTFGDEGFTGGGSALPPLTDGGATDGEGEG